MSYQPNRALQSDFEQKKRPPKTGRPFLFYL
nr:MAG TPA: hypothetical protein [Caudoviricetes sp.]